MNLAAQDITLGIPFRILMINTWIVMAVLVAASYWFTRHLEHTDHPSGGQNYLEAVVEVIDRQIAEISGGHSTPYLAFVGTIFLFILTSNLLAILPSAQQLVTGWPMIYHPPTASLDTTAALALAVLLAVPFFTMVRYGVRHHLSTYLEPTPLMLPFNIIGELSRTLALAVRLFGNMMSGVVMVSIIIGIAPFFFPVLLQLLGLVTGAIQAYIFAVLAMVYIASAAKTQEKAGKHR
jgi:F-type H+-transporting ATPase subunit a